MNISSTSQSLVILAGLEYVVLDHDQIISDETVIVLQWLLYSVICQIINVFGTGTNIINIICFIKQGFKDPVNVSLLGLSISDMGCLITVLWINICNAPTVIQADLPFDPIEVTYASVGMVHMSFSRITCWITALITLERCLCITIPLKVKMIITPQRTAIVIAGVFIILLSIAAPIHVVNRLGLKFFPHKNKTLIGLIPTGDRKQVEAVSFIVNNMTLPFTTFLVIIICTIILVIKLHSKNKWRSKVATAVTDNLSARNQSVAKMVIMISILFIVCFIPVSVIFLAMTLEPSFSVVGPKRNLLTLIAGLCIIIESVNSSSNIFVYYRMSSKYRDVFSDLFCISKLKSPRY